MSVSITPVQTLKTVAASVVNLSRLDPAKEPGLRNAVRSARRMVSDILQNRKETTIDSPEEQAAAIYDVMRAENKAALIARHPSPEVHGIYLDKFAPSLDGKDFNMAIDAVRLRGHEGMEGMAFLRCNMNHLRHGHHDPVDDNNLSQNLAALDRDLGRAMALNSAVAMPTPSKLAESITRIQAHGDYLYGMQSGASTMFEKLDSFGVDAHYEFYGADTLLRTYLEASTNPDSITVPVGGRMNGVTVYGLREGNYRVTNDIPYPTQEDMDTLNKAVEYTKAKLMTLPLVGPDGAALDDVDTRNVRIQFSGFASAQLHEGQSFRMSAFYQHVDKPFHEAAKLVHNDRFARNNELMMVIDGSSGLLPVYHESPTDRKDVSKHVRAIENAITKTGGKAQLVSPADYALLENSGANVQALSVFLSNSEVRELPSQHISIMSAGQYLLNMAVQSAVDNLRNDEGKITSLERHPNDSPDALMGQDLSSLIVEKLKQTLPGVSDGVVESVREAVGKQPPGVTATSVVWGIESKLDTFAKQALLTKGELKPLSPDLGEVEDLTVVLEMPDAGMSPQERRRLQ